MILNNIINRIKQINPELKFLFIGQFDENNQKHGYWGTYWGNGDIQSKGNYLNGKKTGYWNYYWSGNSHDKKGYFKNDILIGNWNYN